MCGYPRSSCVGGQRGGVQLAEAGVLLSQRVTKTRRTTLLIIELLEGTRFRFDLRRGADLVGIAVLGPGMPHALGALFPYLEPAESVVLSPLCAVLEARVRPPLHGQRLGWAPV